MIDLHCDLLSYLAFDPSRTPHDERCRCSYEQLVCGGVKEQVLAAFVPTTPESGELCAKQIEIFKTLSHPEIHFHLAIENASGLFPENAPLVWDKRLPTILYISLTWNTENRFGGGALTSIGLKDDGKWLLQQMNEQNIAIDLSHASDRLAEDILVEIDRQGYTMPLLASHSNARSAWNAPRNLPDHLIKEIVARKGLIGINLYRKFLGTNFPDALLGHVEHFRKLGAEKCLVWGADFFFNDDLPVEYRLEQKDQYFAEAADASCYPLLGKLFDADFRRRIETENFREWKK